MWSSGKLVITKARTQEQQFGAGLWNLCNGISIAGAFISMNGYEPKTEWIIGAAGYLAIPLFNLTDYGYEKLVQARIFLDGWNHILYVSHATFLHGDY